MDTHPDITDFLITGITNWNNSSKTFLLDTSVDSKLLLAFKIQLLLGWESLLYGFLVSPLVNCRQDHYTTKKSRRRGTRGGIQLTTELLNFIFQVWMNMNNTLRESDKHDKLCGKEQLRASIILEYALGIKDLTSLYLPYVYSLHKLLDKSIRYQNYCS